MLIKYVYKKINVFILAYMYLHSKAQNKLHLLKQSSYQDCNTCIMHVEIKVYQTILKISTEANDQLEQGVPSR